MSDIGEKQPILEDINPLGKPVDEQPYTATYDYGCCCKYCGDSEQRNVLGHVSQKIVRKILKSVIRDLVSENHSWNGTTVTENMMR